MVLTDYTDRISLHKLYGQIAKNAAQLDQTGCFPEQEFNYIKEAGLLGITLPGNFLSFDKLKTKELLMLLKEIGKASLPVGRIYEGHINALYLVSLFATPAQKERWFTDVNFGKKLFGVWNTQEANGVRIYDFGNGKYRLKGTKTFCSGADCIDRPLVTGKLISPNKRGWQMFIIPTEKVKAIRADRSFWNPLGMRASVSYKMDLSGIELREADLLGPPDAYYQQPHFSGGAIRFAAVQLGGAEAILEETHRFLRSTHRTDDAYQRARIAEISYLTETGNLWLNQAGAKNDDWIKKPGTADQIVAYANMTRTVVEDICLRTMQLAERSVGSRGFMKPNPLERLHRDLTTYLRQPAPDATLNSIGDYVLRQESTNKLWDDARR
ncbi:acyl-CoA dehydrogenase family protein [Dyadobacter psychrotolerans]|uniref:Acyl-CoA dehydrogenase n=1 Tax=Dyadobacter psychrotolerans TaxID=2541721 RepID=A0A4R5DC62_9BACT|nr:acyl-CoA dehydrogenase family protein [Dyadobacter psychrotolerans]TDE11279.1 acyl-CoA dehydrogenase [Dyadobacter psychrotolerans]